jgi:hypothetical protein
MMRKDYIQEQTAPNKSVFERPVSKNSVKCHHTASKTTTKHEITITNDDRRRTEKPGRKPGKIPGRSDIVCSNLEEKPKIRGEMSFALPQHQMGHQRTVEQLMTSVTLSK